jgi:hypothetical protein
MAQRSDRHKALERAAFEAFLTAVPEFRRQVAGWTQPDEEFPDVRVKLTDGTVVEFELGEWLEPKQMGAAKRREELETWLIEAMNPRPRNETKHIRFVSMEPRHETPRWEERDGAAFRNEMMRLIAEIDGRWETERSWSVRYYFSQRDFKKYPVLDRYLESVLFGWAEVNGVKETPFPDELWLDTAPTGGTYDPVTSLDALEAVLIDKLSKYGSLRKGSQLIIHYSQGWVYNTPFRSLQVETFRDVARLVARALAGRTFPFEKVYLLNAVEAPRPEAFLVYPEFAEWQPDAATR